MRKTTKRGEEAAVENPDVSPPKKSKPREKKTVPAVAPNRLPRAAKNRTVAQANDVENIVEPAKKPRGRARQPLRRSRSSDNIASTATGILKKTKSKSAEHLDREEEGPPPKKVKNPPVKTTKKTAVKKAGTEAKPKAGKKEAKEAPLDDVAEESEEEQRPLIAKKSYRKVTIKAPPVNTKEEKPKKRGAAKETAAPVKPTRGRAKPPAADEVEGDSDVGEAKPAKVKKGKANGKKAAAAPAEEEDEEDAEHVAENAEEVAKPKRGGKRAAPAPKKPRNIKKTAAEPVAKVDTSQEEASVEAEAGEPENTKPTKGGKKGKAPAAKKGGKKPPPAPKDNNNLEDEEVEDDIVVPGGDQEAVDVPQEPQKEPEENAKSLENDESNSEVEYEVEADDHDSR